MHGGKTEIYQKVNVEGTDNVLTVAKKIRHKKLLFTHPLHVIIQWSRYNADGTWPIPGSTNGRYNETKAIAEDMVLKANDPSANFYTIAYVQQEFLAQEVN